MEKENTIKETNTWIMEHYPIQDDTWPSRRWKADMSEYMDMSGEPEEYESNTADTVLKMIDKTWDESMTGVQAVFLKKEKERFLKSMAENLKKLYANNDLKTF